MTDGPPRPRAHRSSCPVRTAYRMADAVDFLIGVAQDSGMCGIAAKLAMVRTDLLVEAKGRHTPTRATETDLDAGQKDGFGGKYN